MRYEKHDVVKRIQACTEDGKVAIVMGGMDCDGVEYNNHVTLINADIEHYETRINEERQNAEGPIWYRIEKPSTALLLRRTERDRVMTAYENGHPHTIRI